MTHILVGVESRVPNGRKLEIHRIRLASERLPIQIDANRMLTHKTGPYSTAQEAKPQSL